MVQRGSGGSGCTAYTVPMSTGSGPPVGGNRLGDPVRREPVEVDGVVPQDLPLALDRDLVGSQLEELVGRVGVLRVGVREVALEQDVVVTEPADGIGHERVLA